MNRRNFLLTSGSIILAKSTAFAQAGTPTAPFRVGTLFDTSKLSGRACFQDSLFDGQQFICLYRDGFVTEDGVTGTTPTRITGFSPDSRFAVAATSINGNLLWSYALPTGNYFSLGTTQGSVVIFALRYTPSGGNPVIAVLRLDPSTGNLAAIGSHDSMGRLSYAGDSTFFRIVKGTGEIWSLDNGLVQKGPGIVSPTLAKKFSLPVLVPPATIAVVDAVGDSMALISLASGSVKESSITSDVIKNSHAIIQALMERVNPTHLRMATNAFISAVGADPTGAIYAVVAAPKEQRGVVPVIKINATGAASDLGKIQLPSTSTGQPMMPIRLAASGSELALLGFSGDAAWYRLPLS